METTTPNVPGTVTVDEDGDVYLVSLHGDPSLPQWDQLLDGISARMLRKPKFVLVVDALELATFAGEARKAVVTWRKANHERYPDAFFGICYVIKSAILRGALQATFWIMRPPVPYVISSTRGGALEWAQSIMRRTLS